MRNGHTYWSGMLGFWQFPCPDAACEAEPTLKALRMAWVESTRIYSTFERESTSAGLDLGPMGHRTIALIDAADAEFKTRLQDAISVAARRVLPQDGTPTVLNQLADAGDLWRSMVRIGKSYVLRRAGLLG